jgi:excisionase family DNA binding protein
MTPAFLPASGSGPSPGVWSIPSAGGLIYSGVSAPAATSGPSAGLLLDPVTGQRLLSTREAAAALGMSHRTLEGLRHRGGGPLFKALGRNLVRYKLDDLMAWVESRSAPHTAKARALLNRPSF